MNRLNPADDRSYKFKKMNNIPVPSRFIWIMGFTDQIFYMIFQQNAWCDAVCASVCIRSQASFSGTPNCKPRGKCFRLTYLFWWTLPWIGFHWLCWTPWVGTSWRGKSFSTEVYVFFVSLGRTCISLKYCDYFFQIFSILSSTVVQFYHAKT